MESTELSEFVLDSDLHNRPPFASSLSISFCATSSLSLGLDPDSTPLITFTIFYSSSFGQLPGCLDPDSAV
jgi:hypothetical protein